MDATGHGGAWDGFKGGLWRDSIDVRDFVQHNYAPYDGAADFLTGPTPRTTAVWQRLLSMFPEENERGVHDVDIATPSRIDAFKPGYVDGTAVDHKDLIVGLQTDAPLKRAIMPNGGWRMVESALNSYGYPADPAVKDIYTHLRKTHNEGVFDAYTPEIRACRSAGLITGLPDAYGRGRIIGDYRRVALYGVDPFGEDSARFSLRPALRWESEVVQVRRLAPGDSTGYGRGFVADEVLDQRHRVLVVHVGLVCLEHRELGVMARRDALVAETAVQLVHTIEAADRNVCPNRTRPHPMSTTTSRSMEATRCSGG